MKGSKLLFFLTVSVLLISMAVNNIMFSDLNQGTVIASEQEKQLTDVLSKENGTSEDKLNEALVLFNNSCIALLDNMETTIDKDNLEITPIIQDGRTLVPLRFVAEAFKADVDWNAVEQTATVKIVSNELIIKIGNNEIQSKNAEGTTTIIMDVAAQSINTRTYVPLRYIAEALGKEVFYDRGLVIISNYKNILDPVKDKQILDQLISKLNNLPIVGNREKFDELTKNYFNNQDQRIYRVEKSIMTDDFMSEDIAFDMVVEEAAEAESDSGSRQLPPSAPQVNENKESSKQESESDYSKTNVQVEGVDEADVVKTDGEYIYYCKNNSIFVVKAEPASNMELLSTVEFNELDFTPIEMYVDKNQLVVIGTLNNNNRNIEFSRYYMYQAATRAYIFDITNRKEIKKIREIDIDGRYITSRKINNNLYMVSNKSCYEYYHDNNNPPLPYYRDSIKSENNIDIDYSRIYYFPTISNYNYTIIAGVQLDEPNKEVNIYTYLGASNNIYVSNEHMYITTVRDNYIQPTPQNSSMSASRYYTNDTQIYKFSLTEGNITYICQNNVPGTVLNQFSMDEYKGYLRIATNSNNYVNSNLTNNIYILDDALNITGRIENIAPGERIYSVRYMQNRGYMVTFKTVDPLFAIDLTDPQNPKILGALKIPGYSDYLHPYDENHLIGFGKDTIEYNGAAYYLGMKISMFDVTDISNPKELFTEKIADRGTESPILSNHKALLFSKEKNIMAFPVAVRKVQQSNNELDYGVFEFQGAYVYSIDINKGFNQKGKITHLSEEDMLKSSTYEGDYQKYIERIIYAKDNLFTLSAGMIKANKIDTLNEIGSLKLPYDEKLTPYTEILEEEILE